MDREISEGQETAQDVFEPFSLHQYPNCLQFEIEIEEIENEANHFNLNLKINFGLQKTIIDDWSISFGIKGGDLSLELINCNASISEDSCLVATPRSIPSDDDNYRIICGVNNMSKTNPGWNFEQPQDMSSSGYMINFLDLKRWVRLEIKSKPCIIKATFAISSLDIVLRESESIGYSNDYENKPKVIKAKILKLLESCKNEDGRYEISQVGEQYG